MTAARESSRRAGRVLGLLAVFGLIPVVGLAIALSGATGSDLPRSVVNACLAMMGAAWQGAERHLAIHPVTTGVVLLLGGSLAWATLRILASVANTRRVLAPSEMYAPGRHPTLDVALAHGALSGLALRVLTSSRPMAFTVGLWHPQIVVSEGMISSLSEAELRAVLFHERSHAHRRDPLRLAFAQFLVDVLWFLPVARPLARDFVDALEEVADASAVEATRGPVELASALVKAAKGGLVWATPLVSSLAGTLSVRDRVERLLGMGNQRRSAATRGRWLASGLIAVALLALSISPVNSGDATGMRALEQAMSRMPVMACHVSGR
jgi:Zn-dependent protease with chaperone function